MARCEWPDAAGGGFISESTTQSTMGRCLPALGLALLAVAGYWPARNGEFLWDDWQLYIVRNSLLRMPDGLWRFWFSTQPPDYYPLAYSSFWFEFRLWGLNPLGYHLVNFALHAGTCIVLWRLMRAMRLPGAWITAAIFAVHPVNVESVAWIAQRKTLLGAGFGFAAWWAYVVSQERSSGAWLKVSVLLFFLSLAGKPVLIMLPLLLLGWRWWARLRTTWIDLLRLAPFFVLSIVMGSVGAWFQYTRALGGTSGRPETLAARIAVVGWATWFYIFKTIVPLKLTFVYPRWNVDAGRWVTFVPLLVLAGVLGIAWRGRATWGRPLLAGLGGFVLSMVPALGLMDVYYWRYSLVGDHYQYQSIVFTIALVVGIVHWVLNRKSRQGVSGRAAAPSVVVLAVLLVLTIRQSGLYAREDVVWGDTLAKNPDAWLARTNLGSIEFRRKNYAKAIEHFQASLRVHQGDPLDYVNLAAAYGMLGRDAEAIQELKTALAMDPGFKRARRDMALAYERLNRMASARAIWEEVLARDPRDAEAKDHIVRIDRGGGD